MKPYAWQYCLYNRSKKLIYTVAAADDLEFIVENEVYNFDIEAITFIEKVQEDLKEQTKIFSAREETLAPAILEANLVNEQYTLKIRPTK